MDDIQQIARTADEALHLVQKLKDEVARLECKVGTLENQFDAMQEQLRNADRSYQR